MLRSLDELKKTMCPGSAAREKPFACRGLGCAGVRAQHWPQQLGPAPDVTGLGWYCGAAGEPNTLVPLPTLLTGTGPATVDSSSTPAPPPPHARDVI